MICFIENRKNKHFYLSNYRLPNTIKYFLNKLNFDCYESKKENPFSGLLSFSVRKKIISSNILN